MKKGSLKWGVSRSIPALNPRGLFFIPIMFFFFILVWPTFRIKCVVFLFPIHLLVPVLHNYYLILLMNLNNVILTTF